MNKNENFSTLTKVGIGLAAGLGAVWLGRYTVRRTVNNITKKFMTEPYDNNLWELISASTRIGVQNIVENNLRAQRGKIIERPLGSPRKFVHFDDLMFDIAQLKRLPVEKKVQIDTQTIIGPEAKKPLILDIPIAVAGMAYGSALSEKVKIAIAKATAMAGTATNTGEGSMLPSERKAAKYVILQYPRAHWARDKQIIKMADAIEIQLGQGAQAGIAHYTEAKKLDTKTRKLRKLKKGEKAVIQAGLPEMKRGHSLKEVIDGLRRTTGGIPVGVKIATGKYIEEDMRIALDAGVDFIVLDGAQAATKGAPPIIQDDFGLPTLYALCRAVRFLEKTGYKNKVTLIIAGGLFNPGHFLKAIALGADVVYIGTAALYTVSHNQVFQALPFEPPTQVTWHTGAFRKQFNVNTGAKTLYNFLKSCREEMEDGVRALGKTSIKEVNKSVLMALTPQVAEITGVDLAY